MLISLHMPKTAGSSFLKALEMRFGHHLLKDYRDFPMNTPERQRKERALADCQLNAGRDFGAVQCIHGHFLPLKYLGLSQPRQVTFITWLRDPIERMASNYFYWKKAYNPAGSGALHKRCVEEGWSLERFCFCPEMQNMYSQYLWKFPLKKFDFIGIFEHFDEDYQYFLDCVLRHPLPKFAENVNPNRKEAYITDPGLRAELERFHSSDMAIYRWALERRRQRMKLP